MSDYKDIFSGDKERYEKPEKAPYDAAAADNGTAPLTADEINGSPSFCDEIFSSERPAVESAEPFDTASSAPNMQKDDFVIGSGFVVSDDYAAQIRSRKERVNEQGKQRPVSERDVDIRKVSKQEAKKKKENEKKSKRHGPLYTLIWVGAILIVSGLFAIFAILFAVDLLGISDNSTKKSIYIEKGMNTAQIAEILADDENNIIEYPMLFRLYVKLKGKDGTLQYGGFELHESMGYDTIIESLQKANARETVNVEIPDGATIETIRKLLAEKDVCTVEQFNYVIDHLERYDFDADFVKAIPEDNVYYSLEGYLYPDTYNFFTGAEKYGEKNCVNALNKMINNLDSKLNEQCPDYKERIKKLDYYGIESLHDALSLASIVQLECSGFDNEMPGVAAVFLNRLVWEGEARYLGSTPTFYYPDNRYNTNSYAMVENGKQYKKGYEGLPPGPQCSMTIEAIKSVLYPNEENISNKYYYFVTDVNHKFYYNRTLKQHESTIASLKKQGLWA